MIQYYDPTINIPNAYFTIFCTIPLYFIKMKIHHKIKTLELSAPDILQRCCTNPDRLRYRDIPMCFTQGTIPFVLQTSFHLFSANVIGSTYTSYSQ